MSAALKKQKDLQEQVQKTFMHVVNDIIVAHMKLIGIVILVIILIVAGVMGWNSYAKKVNDRALALEAEALQLFNEVSQSADEVSQSADEVSQSAASSDEETTEADAPSKSWEDVLAAYQQVLDQYPKSKSAERVLYLSGSLNYTLGNYEDAQNQFTTYITKYENGTLRYQAEESLGYIFEQQGEYQKALDTFKRIEANVPASRKSALLLAIGRNYENLENVDQAITIYQGIVDSNTSADWKDMARERLEILQPAPLAAVEETEETKETEETEETSEDTPTENNS
jgi:TolA-binding protein